MVLMATLTLIERRGIGRHDSTHVVRKVHRHRGKEVMTRAAADQKIHHRSMCIVIAAFRAGGPADDAAVVVVAVADHVAAGIDELANHREVALRGHPVQHVRVVTAFAIVHVETELEKQVHGVETPALRRGKEQRFVVRR